MSTQLKLLAGTVLLGAIAVTSFLHVQSGQDAARWQAARLFSHGVLPMVAIQNADAMAARLEEQYAATPRTPVSSPELAARLGDILAALGDVDAAVQDPGALGQRIAELRVLVSRLKAANGEVSDRLLRRELAEISSGITEILPQVRSHVQAGTGATEASLAASERAGTAGIVALLLTLGLVAWLVSSDLQRRLRGGVDALRGLGAREPSAAPPGSTFRELQVAITDLAERLGANRLESEQAGAKAAEGLQAEIARLEKRFEATIERMQEGFCLIDEKRRLVAANAPFRRIFEGLQPGADGGDLKDDPALAAVLGAHGSGAVVTQTEGGRVLELRRHAVSGRSTIILVNDITERQAASRTIERLAGCDMLTGLPNRARFLGHLTSLLSDRRRQQDLAVLCFDIQGFRDINAAHGSAVGDLVLRGCAERLAGVIGDRDFLARIGADEFAIVQESGSQPESGEALARAALDALTVPLAAPGRELQARLSAGIVHVKPKAGGAPIDPYAILRDAEAALAQAQTEQPGGYRIFSETIRRQADERRSLEADLRQALERGELSLHFQPFADVRAGVVSGFEALLRWTHPERGAVPPARFIPVAEAAGLMDAIGAFVLTQACATAADWPDHLSVSVNLSALQFRNPALLADIEATLAATGLRPDRLELEITESVFLEDVEGTLVKLKALRALGARILMDDFGTGYSSLGYLSRFPFDKLKIDQSFVRDMGRRENLAIVRAMIGLSRSMGLGVIAEGVETREQFEALRREGCEEMQGFLIGRPGPASELARHLVRVERSFQTGEFARQSAVA